MKTAAEWIQELGMAPHPEGGYYVQTDVSTSTYAKGDKQLPLYTNIHFLLTADNPSRFHQLTSDELWFYHAGSPLTVHSLHPDGNYSHVTLGLEAERGQTLHHNVPAGVIFASSVEEGYALVSCTVVPGFDFADFKLFTQSELLEKYSNHKQIIEKLAYDTLPSEGL